MFAVPPFSSIMRESASLSQRLRTALSALSPLGGARTSISKANINRSTNCLSQQVIPSNPQQPASVAMMQHSTCTTEIRFSATVARVRNPQVPPPAAQPRVITERPSAALQLFLSLQTVPKTFITETLSARRSTLQWYRRDPLSCNGRESGETDIF